MKSEKSIMKTKKTLTPSKELYALAQTVREAISHFTVVNGYDSSLVDAITKSLPDLYSTLDNVDTMMSNARNAITLFEQIKSLKNE